MPLFEYECLTCEKRFEEVVLGSERPSCPACRGRELRKLLSVFAVGSGQGAGRSTQAPSGCGSCGDPRGPGSCAVN